MLQVFDTANVAQSPRLVADDGGALFCPGKFDISMTALLACEAAKVAIVKLTTRHVMGDWGDLFCDDWRGNNAAIARDEAILSQYNIGGGQQVWIMTTADRSMTYVYMAAEWPQYQYRR